MDTRGRLRNDSANENKEIEVVIKPFEFYFLKNFMILPLFALCITQT